MEPLSLALAAGSYVAAKLAKKSADAVIDLAYKRIEKYLKGKLGLAARVEDLDAAALTKAGLAADPTVIAFGAEVLAHSPALRRARLVAKVLHGARVLWVDDEPKNNINECRMFASLGATVGQVETTRNALAGLTGGTWDVLLSDVARDGGPDAGLRMLTQLPSGSPPVVLYVGRVDPARPVPVGAFGVADQPDPLLHLVLDALERSRL